MSVLRRPPPSAKLSSNEEGWVKRPAVEVIAQIFGDFKTDILPTSVNELNESFFREIGEGRYEIMKSVANNNLDNKQISEFFRRLTDLKLQEVFTKGIENLFVFYFNNDEEVTDFMTAILGLYRFVESAERTRMTRIFIGQPVLLYARLIEITGVN